MKTLNIVSLILGSVEWMMRLISLAFLSFETQSMLVGIIAAVYGIAGFVILIKNAYDWQWHDKPFKTINIILTAVFASVIDAVFIFFKINYDKKQDVSPKYSKSR